MCLRLTGVDRLPVRDYQKAARSGGPVNRSRKSIRTLGLGVALLLAAALGSAATVPKALRGGLRQVSGFRKVRAATIRPSQSFACTTSGIACNTTVNAELTTDDCQGPNPDDPSDRSFYDAWTFQATAGQTVQITMTSTAFNTFLFLFNPNGDFEYNDDYLGGGTNSRISFPVTESGTYTIKANSFAAGVTGAYSLQLVCASLTPPGLVTLPAAASLHGAPPTFFHSDVSVFNPSATQSATVTAHYRCFTGACGNAVQTFTVLPRQMRVFEDIVGTLFGAAETGGAVEFSGNVLVDSRLYTPSRPAPTVGMYVPGLSTGEAYAEAVLTSLSFSTNLSTGFRTNVGVYNANDVAQTVTFTLYNPQGVQIGQTAQLVAARTPLQINNIASFVGITTDVPNFYCVVRGDGVSKNYAYAAVLDNQSQDLIFVKGAQARLP